MPCQSILAFTDIILRCNGRRLGRGCFFSSNGLVSRGWRLINWVVNGLTTLRSLVKLGHWVKDRWNVAASTKAIHNLLLAFWTRRGSSNGADGHSKRDGWFCIVMPFIILWAEQFLLRFSDRLGRVLKWAA